MAGQAQSSLKQKKLNEESLKSVKSKENTAELPAFKQTERMQGEAYTIAADIFAERYTTEEIPGKELKTKASAEYTKSLEGKLLSGIQKGKKTV